MVRAWVRRVRSRGNKPTNEARPVASLRPLSMFPRVVQRGDGSEETQTRTSTGTGTSTGSNTGDSDAGDAVPAPRHPSATPSNSERLPAPLQYRDPARYDIVAEHGRGGLGRVYRARDKELGRDVALKELLSRGSTTELRFFREALITARLEHPGIVPIHEAGRWPDGTPFYAMKLVAGRPLKALIDDCRTLEDRLALLPHVIAVADAIAYAHDRKIIHRDLKPSNIIVGDFGETVVIDWGLAKDISDQAPADDPVEDGPFRTAAPGAGDGVTVAGSVVGTPAYMSPEQARGDLVDERTDVYAIGAILLSLVHRDSPRESLPRGIDPDLRAIIRRATATDILDRYGTASSLSRDLHAYAKATRITARRYGFGSLVRLWYRRNPRVAIVVVAAAALLLVVGTSSARAIISERDEAERARISEAAARNHADEQRDVALVAQARMALERDPTSANALLDGEVKSIEAELLMSRARGARIAAHAFTLPQRISDASLSEDGAEVAVGSIDRALRIFSLNTGETVVSSREIPEYTPLQRQHGGWWFVASPNARPELRHTRQPVRFALNAEARTIRTSSKTTLVLLANGTLLSFRLGETPREIARNIVESAITSDDMVFACTGRGELLRGTATSVPLRIEGRCDPRASTVGLVASAQTAVIPTAPGWLTVVRAGRDSRYKLASNGPLRDVAVCPSGIVGLVDGQHDGQYVDAKGVLRPGFPRDQRANRVACNGSRIAWGYQDGSVMVLDTAAPTDWTLLAHASSPDTLQLSDDGNTLLTVSAGTARIWDLSTPEPMPTSESSCLAFNLVQSPSLPDWLAADCAGGHVWVFNLADGTARSVHRHDEVSFSVAWIGATVCSGGWDGRVLCTDMRDGATSTIAAHSVATRWLASDDETLFYVTADGGVWTFDPRASPTEVRNIATTAGEPYRIAVQRDFVLVSTRIGSVVTIDRTTGRSHVQASHTDVAALTNAPEDITFSSASDGTVQEWHRDTARRRWRFSGRLRDVRAIGAGGFAATLDDNSLIIAGGITNLRLPIGAPVSKVAGSQSQVGAVVSKQELLILDSVAATSTVVPIHDGEIRTVAALSDDRFAAATSTGALYVVDPQKFPSHTLAKETSYDQDQATIDSLDCSHAIARLTRRGCRWRTNDEKRR
jgi:serine/threonine protein kinase/WD40 repeat protein